MSKMGKSSSKETAFRLIRSLQKRISENHFSTYWPDFSPYPFACFDETSVYLCNHPHPPKNFTEEEGIFIGPRDHRFYGNTSIELEEVPTAIFDLAFIPEDIEYAKLYSLMVHEMYHSYQNAVGYQRGSNELLYIKYPQTENHIAIRLLERRTLLKAIFSETPEDKQFLVNQFFSLREERRKRIGKYVDFELGLESVEGLAVYVESKAYADDTGYPEKFIRSLFCKDLIEPKGTVYDLRRSCYSSGLAIAYLLDDLFPGWKKDYMASKDFLYDDFLNKWKGNFNRNFPSIDQDTEWLASQVLKKEFEKRDEEFKQFYKSDGYLISIKGHFHIYRFDPMNLLPKENQLLHKHFLQCKINDETFVLNEKCITTLTGETLECSELQFFSNNYPKQHGNQIEINGFGIVEGVLRKMENTYEIILSNKSR